MNKCSIDQSPRVVQAAQSESEGDGKHFVSHFWLNNFPLLIKPPNYKLRLVREAQTRTRMMTKIVMCVHMDALPSIPCWHAKKSQEQQKSGGDSASGNSSDNDSDEEEQYVRTYSSQNTQKHKYAHHHYQARACTVVAAVKKRWDTRCNKY